MLREDEGFAVLRRRVGRRRGRRVFMALGAEEDQFVLSSSGIFSDAVDAMELGLRFSEKGRWRMKH
jgi:hypothetical protein